MVKRCQVVQFLLLLLGCSGRVMSSSFFKDGEIQEAAEPVLAVRRSATEVACLIPRGQGGGRPGIRLSCEFQKRVRDGSDLLGTIIDQCDDDSDNDDGKRVLDVEEGWQKRAQQGGMMEKAKKFSKTTHGKILIGGLAIKVVFSGAAYYYWQSHKKEQAENHADSMAERTNLAKLTREIHRLGGKIDGMQRQISTPSAISLTASQNEDNSSKAERDKDPSAD